MRRVLVFLLLTTACGRPQGGSAACGIAALAGPMAVLGEFSTPGQTMALPPDSLPGHMVARLVAGPALPALVGRDQDRWMVGVEGQRPAKFSPSFGVVVADQRGRPLGILVYEAAMVRGAPILGHVAIADTTVPLIGIRMDPAHVQDPRCPLFPDSVLH
jgi:hypothetical protein